MFEERCSGTIWIRGPGVVVFAKVRRFGFEMKVLYAPLITCAIVSLCGDWKEPRRRVVEIKLCCGSIDGPIRGQEF